MDNNHVPLMPQELDFEELERRLVVALGIHTGKQIATMHKFTQLFSAKFQDLAASGTSIVVDFDSHTLTMEEMLKSLPKMQVVDDEPEPRGPPRARHDKMLGRPSKGRW